MFMKKLFLGSIFAASVCLSLNSRADEGIVEGTRLLDFENELRRVYPQSTRVEEYSFVPVKWGGISLMGLISRLVGDRPQPFESMHTRRYIYRAYQGDEVIGISHGSSIQTPNNQPMDLFVFYNTDTSVRDVRVDRAPSNVIEELSKGGYLKQFLNRPTEDFTVTIGKRGRVKNWGNFAREAKRPQDKALAEYFDKIVRSMRYNAALVEVAYFIGQHPQTTQANASQIQ
jgi:hypothetical protein